MGFRELTQAEIMGKSTPIPAPKNNSSFDTSQVRFSPEEQASLASNPALAQVIGQKKQQVQQAKSQNLQPNIGTETLDVPFMRFATSLTDNPQEAVDYLNNKYGDNYSFDLDNQGHIIYSDDGSTWNRYQTTFPEHLTAKGIGSSIAQKLPDIAELFLGGFGGAAGAPAGPGGAALGAGLGSGVANAGKQLLSSARGVSPVWKHPGESLQELGTHAGLNAIGEGLGRTAMPFLEKGLAGSWDTGLLNPLKAQRQYLPSEKGEALGNLIGEKTGRVGKILGNIGEKVEGGGPYQQSLERGNENYVNKNISNLDQKMLDMPVGYDNDVELALNSSLKEFNEPLKKAFQLDKQINDEIVKNTFREVREGGEGNFLDEGAPGLNKHPFDKIKYINDLNTLKSQMRTPEGIKKIDDIILDVNSGKQTNLGDFQDLKTNLKDKLGFTLNMDKPVKSDYTLINKGLEEAYSSQIAIPELARAYSDANKMHGFNQQIMAPIQKAIVKNQDFSGLDTVRMMKSIKPLLDDLEKQKGEFFSMVPQNTISLLQRALGTELREGAIPKVAGPGVKTSVDWSFLDKFMQDPKKSDYLKRMLDIPINGMNKSGGEASKLIDTLNEIERISQNPKLYPSTYGKPESILDKLPLGLGETWKGTKAIGRGARSLATQGLYNPEGMTARIMAQRFHKEVK